MTAVDLLAELATAGVAVWRDGERLRFRAAPEALTPERIALLREHKPSLLAILPAAPLAGVWWPDPALAPPQPEADEWGRWARAGFAPIRFVPPRGCPGPVACSRLGPCERAAEGRPCGEASPRREDGEESDRCR